MNIIGYRCLTESIPMFAELCPISNFTFLTGAVHPEEYIEPAARLPAMSLGEEMIEDYAALRLSLRAHPLALLRPILTPC